MSSTPELTRPVPAPTAPPSASARSGRDPWFDNAKMLLVTLVVVGHSWTLLPEDSLARNWFYDFLYLWHMPAFLIVTGYLSRSFTYSRRNLSRLVTVVAVPYVVFETALAGFRMAVGGEGPFHNLLLEPHWPMWFLATLFFWRLATPVLTSVRASLALSVAVSLLGGLLPGEVLDIGRITGMLPFFVLGLVARPEHVELLRGRRARTTAATMLLIAFGAAAFIDGHMRTEWLYWRASYADLDATFAEGVLMRLGLLVLTSGLGLAALALVPRRSRWFTRLGAATMVVYLFHAFFVKAAEFGGVFGWASSHPWLGLVAASAAAAALATGLAAPPVARRLTVAVDPVGALRRRLANTRSPGETARRQIDASGSVSERPRMHLVTTLR